ncbi:hypothetical protein FRC07_003535 [Ceratobasidium sp. 392]|nr:hypothetical protein FRC07_003535 [Ceratobasidium sp. 392]
MSSLVLDSGGKGFAGYAYVVVVPYPSRGVTGIKVSDGESGNDNGLGEYVFWIKVGDIKESTTEVYQYQNPDQGISLVWLTNIPNARPGRALAREHLEDVGESAAGWHALYAQDQTGALELCKALRKFLKQYECNRAIIEDKRPVVTQEYNLFSDALREAIYRRSHNHPVDGTELLKERRHEVLGVYLLVTPNVRALNEGFSSALSPYRKFWVQIQSVEAETSTTFALIADKFRSQIPSFSYNAFRVGSKEELPNAVQLMNDELHKVLNKIKCSNESCEWSLFENGWTLVEGQFDQRQLEAFVDWFEEGPIDLSSYRRVEEDSEASE